MISFSEAKSILESVTNIIKKSTTLDLQEKIISLREFIVSIKDENIALKEDNQALRLQLKTEDDFILENGVYWRDGDKIPFCQKCLDGSKKCIHLQISNMGGWRCLECGSYYRNDQPYINVLKTVIDKRDSATR